MRLESQNRFPLSHLMQRWSPAQTPCWQCCQTCRDLQTHEDGDAGNNMAAEKTSTVSRRLWTLKHAVFTRRLFYRANWASVWMRHPQHFWRLYWPEFFILPNLFLIATTLFRGSAKVISFRDTWCCLYPWFVFYFLSKTIFSRPPPIFSDV